MVTVLVYPTPSWNRMLMAVYCYGTVCTPKPLSRVGVFWGSENPDLYPHPPYPYPCTPKGLQTLAHHYQSLASNLPNADRMWIWAHIALETREINYLGDVQWTVIFQRLYMAKYLTDIFNLDKPLPTPPPPYPICLQLLVHTPWEDHNIFKAL